MWFFFNANFILSVAEFGKEPLIILIGNKGVGKTSLADKIKLNEEIKKDFNITTERTTDSETLTIPGKLKICHTKGNSLNPLPEWIKVSISNGTAARIIIVQKAETRIESVVDLIESFKSLNFQYGICITHLDTVKWGNSDASYLKETISNETGVPSASLVFSDATKPGKVLLEEIMKLCNIQEA